MKHQIAMGFHTTVDNELVWEPGTVNRLVHDYGISSGELDKDLPINSERDLLLVSLAYIREGTGGEFTPESNEVLKQFASRFPCRETIGGTASRAAVALSRLGYETSLSMSTWNHVVREQLPEEVSGFSNVGTDERPIYPHVILTYPRGAEIRLTDGVILAPRENRLMFSHDPDSMNMEISVDFLGTVPGAEVFLVGAFCEILEERILKDRIGCVREILRGLKPESVKIYEDACYINRQFRLYVLEQLMPYVNAVSMNEDELAELLPCPLDIRSPEAAADAMKQVAEQLHIPLLIVHSSDWAMAYGEGAAGFAGALRGGVCLSGTRFIYGDSFGPEEYRRTERLPEKKSAQEFAHAVSRIYGDRICCIPAKDLSFVSSPTVVGLGDCFAGGMLPWFFSGKVI